LDELEHDRAERVGRAKERLTPQRMGRRFTEEVNWKLVAV
jgi:hypothetical protein